MTPATTSTGAPQRPRARQARWLVRTAAVGLLLLAAGHVAAVWGMWRGMPPPLWGDEQRHALQVLQGALQVVWMPLHAVPDAEWPASVGRLVFPGVFAWLVGELGIAMLASRLRRLVMVRAGGHAVLAGSSPVGEALATAWVRAGRPVLLLSPVEEDRFIADRIGAAFVLGDPGDAGNWVRAGLGQAGFLACVGPDDLRNVDAAAAALSWARAHRDPDRGQLHCYVALVDPYHRVALSERLAPAAQAAGAELHVFSAPQIAVRRLLRAWPLQAFREQASRQPAAWVFGCGTAAEELVLTLLRLGCWRQGLRPSITVVDRGAAAFGSAFVDRWGGAGAAAQVRFVTAGAEQGQRLFDELAADGLPHAVFLARAGDADNLADAMTLLAAFHAAGRPAPPLHVLQQAPVERSALASHPWLLPFGDANAVAAELVQGERLDAMARSIHERYVREALEGGAVLGARRSLQHWPELPLDLKDDNRAVADHHFVKVVDSGCVLVPASGGDPGAPWHPAEIEELSRAEHDRWNTQRELAGWRHAPERDDARKLHPDLVPWDALPEPRRELDRAVVRQVAALFAAAGESLRREHALLVLGPRTPWAFTPGYEAATQALPARLAAAHPGAAVRLWFEPECALACRLAEHWRGAGGLLGVVLRQPLAAWLDRLPDPVRQRLLALLAAADRIWCSPNSPPPGDLACEGSLLQLSVDGTDFTPGAAPWVLDAEGRLLAEPGAAGRS
jgi:hypothetical protein